MGAKMFCRKSLLFLQVLFFTSSFAYGSAGRDLRGKSRAAEIRSKAIAKLMNKAVLTSAEREQLFRFEAANDRDKEDASVFLDRSLREIEKRKPVSSAGKFLVQEASSLGDGMHAELSASLNLNPEQMCSAKKINQRKQAFEELKKVTSVARPEEETSSTASFRAAVSSLASQS